MKNGLKVYFILVLVAMVAVTGWASLHENVVAALLRISRDPWGLATLFDCYFAFLAFWLWVAYKESRWVVRLLWLVAILLLGNIAMALYALIQVWRLPQFGGMNDLFRRAPR